MSEYTYNHRDWDVVCDCGEAHDTYNGPSFPLSQCAGRDCRTKICCECECKCDDCGEAFCEGCAVVSYDTAGHELTLCFRCVLVAADEMEQEQVKAVA